MCRHAECSCVVDHDVSNARSIRLLFLATRATAKLTQFHFALGAYPVVAECYAGLMGLVLGL